MSAKKKTSVAQAIDASKGQETETGKRGYYDGASKRIVSTRMILAWIVRACVPQAAEIPVRKLAEEAIPGKVHFREIPVYREDAEDPGNVQMEPTEDAAVYEGTVRYDILFELKLPGTAPITVIINVELQNKTDLPYPPEARAMSYAARQLGQQGPDYDNLKKVYTIWIVSNPAAAERNTIVRYQIKKTVSDGQIQPPGAADLMEAVFLNLGPEQDVEVPKDPEVLRLLDVLFSNDISTADKKTILETDFGIPMTKEVVSDMEAMADLRFGFEVEAEERGEKRGEQRMLFNLVKEGDLSAEKAARILGMTKEQFLQKLTEAEQDDKARNNTSS